MSGRPPDDLFFETLAAGIEPQQKAPSRLKSRIYSRLMREQGAAVPLPD